MNREDIERMAREAKGHPYTNRYTPGETAFAFSIDRLERFAALVAAAERAACAKVCEENGKEPDDHKSYEGYDEGYQDGSNNCAAAIRARSNP